MSSIYVSQRYKIRNAHNITNEESHITGLLRNVPQKRKLFYATATVYNGTTTKNIIIAQTYLHKIDLNNIMKISYSDKKI